MPPLSEIGLEMTTAVKKDIYHMSHQPGEGREKVRLKVNPSREDTTDGSVPQQAEAAVTASRECVCAPARSDGTWWYYQFLAELFRSGVLVRHVSQLNRDGVDNLLDVPALDSVVIRGARGGGIKTEAP